MREPRSARRGAFFERVGREVPLEWHATQFNSSIRIWPLSWGSSWAEATPGKIGSARAVVAVPSSNAVLRASKARKQGRDGGVILDAGCGPIEEAGGRVGEDCGDVGFKVGKPLTLRKLAQQVFVGRRGGSAA